MPGRGGYVVRDANGQALAYVYSRNNEAEAHQAKVLTSDEARRIAMKAAGLIDLVRKRNDRRLALDQGLDLARGQVLPGPQVGVRPRFGATVRFTSVGAATRR
jgi:hypothetical protein